MPHAREAHPVSPRPAGGRRRPTVPALQGGSPGRRSPPPGLHRVPSLKGVGRDGDQAVLDVALGRRSALGQRRNVSFNDVLEVEVPHIDHPHPTARQQARSSSPDSSRRQRRRGGDLRRDGMEDVASRNLHRLTANHRRMANDCPCWSGTCYAGLRMLGLCAQGLGLLPGIIGYHARIDGDVMLVGDTPGEFHSALILAGATITVEGSQVEIRAIDSPVCSIRLSCPSKAHNLAAKARHASRRMEEASKIYASHCKKMEMAEHCEEALESEQLEERRCGDVGGTP
eukprot:CAMPEP_0178444080 /NCGR_PEP_ID=MMETSP0689_2-20121128/39283_1 /TAXON_ID=160604 /ORGANISM="Amphidinium massartii, Strain CS-259" /LENGTH=284 /DNA_ID=CAMNT_0020068221 /DNA_START=301 /DNA_END=1155 /DNA_ORIENTATION=-